MTDPVDQPDVSPHDGHAAEANSPTHEAVTVVGLGASAGGLEALRLLVGRLSTTSGLAYVVVQHLSTTHQSMLVTLLARETRLPVHEVSDGTVPRANTIYVAPAGLNIELTENTLHLTPPGQGGVPKPSVDEFFTTLADSLGERAIGVVLSGTGSDGARGIRAIRAAGGVTIAQDEATSKYFGMPHAAIESGCVDMILPPEQIAARLSSVGELYVTDGANEFEGIVLSDFERITRTVRRSTGIDLSAYKESTLQRRLRRRLVATQSPTLEQYETLLRTNPQEVERLAQEVLISVTSFFRDKAAFAELANTIATIAQRKSDGDEMRMWVAGCATGEEAYSIGILAADALLQSGKRLRVQVFATDLDAAALARARRGVFSATDVAGIPAPYLERYFTHIGDVFHIDKRIREMIIFSAQNLTRDPPFLKLDLVSCRNVLIYFTPEIQERLLTTFNFALRSDGYLFLGKSEATYKHERLFTPVNERLRIYRRLDAGLSRPSWGVLAGGPDIAVTKSAHEKKGRSLPERVLTALQGTWLPAAVVIDQQFDIKYVYGDITEFAKLPAGEPKLNLAAMANPGIRVDLRSIVLLAQRDHARPVVRRVEVSGMDRLVDIGAVSLGGADAQESPLVLVTFAPVADAHATVPGLSTTDADRDGRMLALEEQLAANREHLHTVIEELETSNEELQSLNEEMQSANEELQSTNEELETSNEELQSTNEELTTVNEELETKTNELVRLNNSLENVKESLVYPLIVVDAHDRILLYNAAATAIFDLTPAAVGEVLYTRPMWVEIDGLRETLADVMARGVCIEQQIQSTRSYALTVKPFVDDHGRRQGALLSFVDNTDIMTAEANLVASNNQLQASEHFIRSTMDALPQHVCVVDQNGVIVAANRRWECFFGENGGSAESCGIGADYLKTSARAAASDPAAAAFHAGLMAVLDGKEDFFTTQYECSGPERTQWFEATVVPFPGKGRRRVVISHEDITARRESEQQIRLQSRALDAASNGIVIADLRTPDQVLVYVNKEFENMTGYSAAEVLGRNCRFLQGDDRQQPALSRLRADLAAKKPGRNLLRNYRKDGTQFWNELSLYPISDDLGEPMYVVGVQRDITASVQREEQLKATVAHEKLALAFAHVGTSDWDVRSGQITGSEIFFHLLGTHPFRRVIDQANFFAVVHADDRPVLDDAVKLCVTGHSPLDVEYRIIWPDGSVHWIHTRGDIALTPPGNEHRIVCLSQDVTERREVDERIRFIAHHDVLTGLPNRALLRDRLQQALSSARRERTRVAVLFVDLDHFKTVNDSLGHQAGDALLRSVANRLQGCIRASDTLCRQSGDEYLLLLPHVRDISEVTSVATKVVQALSSPHSIDDRAVTITGSVGISMYPDDGEGLDDLIRNADAAMYHAKSAGRRNFQFFAPDMNASAIEKLSRTNDLRLAVSSNQLRLVYQPQLDISTQQLVGIEALVRWQRNDATTWMPDEFIPLAEETGLIIELGEWVLNTACMQHQAWIESGLITCPIAVNFSPLQFRHNNVLEMVTDALQRSGLHPSLLEIELTEKAIIDDADHAVRTLQALSDLGVSVALDDFGTGYSNLSNLLTYPVKKLKIDRSFITDAPTNPGVAAIARTVIGLGASLQLDVVAEGVETEAQLRFLQDENCPSYQGYLATAAVPVDELTAMVTSQPWLAFAR
jgi:two-component system, chemotaxis family, CheB/CheR fusion protein